MKLEEDECEFCRRNLDDCKCNIDRGDVEDIALEEVKDVAIDEA